MRWLNTDTIMFAFLFCFVIFFIWGIVAMNKQDAKRTEFIKQCIEFQTVDRCHELFNWGRTDLMKVKP